MACRLTIECYRVVRANGFYTSRVRRIARGNLYRKSLWVAMCVCFVAHEAIAPLFESLIPTFWRILIRNLFVQLGVLFSLLGSWSEAKERRRNNRDAQFEISQRAASKT